MVLLKDGNSEYGAHACRKIGRSKKKNSICDFVKEQTVNVTIRQPLYCKILYR